MFKKFKKGLDKVIHKIKIKQLDEKSFEKFSWELQSYLIKNGVAVEIAEKITLALKQKIASYEFKRFDDLKKQLVIALKETFHEILTESYVPFDIIQQITSRPNKRYPYIILFLGINGTGKTTSIAKLAKYLKDNGIKVVISASDTFRAGSIQQIQQHGEKIGVRVVAQTYGSDAAAVAFDAIEHARSNNLDCVLIDTAGRMQNNINLMNEMKKIIRVTEPDLKILNIDALSGNDALNQLKMFDQHVGVDALVIAKADAEEKGGTLLSVVALAKKPVVFIGTGQGYSDFITYEPSVFIERLFS